MSVLNQAENRPLNNKIQIHCEEPMATNYFSRELAELFRYYKISRNQPIVLLCIGTDRSTGDCLGPLVGAKISSFQQSYYHIYGTLDQPVHANNLSDKIKEIQDSFNNPFIIAIDACLGDLEKVGYITLGHGSLQPGAGVNKKLPPVGHIHITGIVNVGGFMEYLVLQNTRLNLVMRIANIMAEGLMEGMTLYQQQNELNSIHH